VKKTSVSRTRISPAKRLSAAVYDEIKTRILSGYYSPGEWLSVEELCQMFEVSRQPVMEAMRRLSGDWLVEIHPQVGCRIAGYDRRAITDFINTFGEMEAHIAAIAAKRRTPEQLTHLIEVADTLCRSTALDTENRLVAREYHHTILEMAHSAVLARLCEQMWDFGWFVSSVEIPPETESKIVQRQNETLALLTDAIRVQNEVAARLYMAVWLTGLSPTAGTDEAEADVLQDGDGPVVSDVAAGSTSD
jgi:DNA-binding GntR family transcriptional regulator